MSSFLGAEDGVHSRSRINFRKSRVFEEFTYLKGPRTQRNRLLELQYYNYNTNGIWALKFTIWVLGPFGLCNAEACLQS